MDTIFIGFEVSFKLFFENKPIFFFIAAEKPITRKRIYIQDLVETTSFFVHSLRVRLHNSLKELFLTLLLLLYRVGTISYARNNVEAWHEQNLNRHLLQNTGITPIP